jgi:hypothetical protein
MFTLRIASDVRPARDKLNSLSTALGDRALVSALNKTVAQAKTQMSTHIREEFNISAALVRERLSVTRASRSGQRYSATLLGNPYNRAKRSMNVINFLERKVTLAEARRRKKSDTLNQLRFKIRRTGGKATIKGAFILPVPGSPVFQRVGPAHGDIKPVQTIGVPQMFNTKRVNLPVQQWVTDNFPRIYDEQARYYLSTIK